MNFNLERSSLPICGLPMNHRAFLTENFIGYIFLLMETRKNQQKFEQEFYSYCFFFFVKQQSYLNDYITLERIHVFLFKKRLYLSNWSDFFFLLFVLSNRGDLTETS